MKHFLCLRTLVARTVQLSQRTFPHRCLRSHLCYSTVSFKPQLPVPFIQNCQSKTCIMSPTRTINQLRSSSSDDFDIDSLFDDDLVDSAYNDDTSFQYSQRNSYEESGFGSSLEKPIYEEADLPIFPKKFYKEHSITANRSQEEIAAFYKAHSITVHGENPPKPLLSFEEAQFPHNISRTWEKKLYEKPTPIQSIAWPITLSGRNVIGIAQTGSGKTLSFLIPAVVHIKAQERLQPGEGPIALVLCPTRELAKQCQDVARTSFSNLIRTACLYGGGERRQQLDDLYRGCELAIATPGRLMDLLENKALTLTQCTYLVLDEADRMLDMGFEPQIRKIINQIRPDRQVTMWSATWPKDVEKLASKYLMSEEDPVHIKVGSADLTANKNVEQVFHICALAKKDGLFPELLEKLIQDFVEKNGADEGDMRKRLPKILVFANTKRTCENLVYSLKRNRVWASTIHGNLSQSKRDSVLFDFRKGKTTVLIATDVAARGLDVDNIDYVVNYDMPNNCVSYIHRIGRTGRGVNTGTSVTLLTEVDGAVVPSLIQNLKVIDHPVDEKLLKMEQWYQSRKGSATKRQGSGQRRMQSSYNNNQRYDNRAYNRSSRYGQHRNDNYGSYSSRNPRHNHRDDDYQQYHGNKGYRSQSGGWDD